MKFIDKLENNPFENYWNDLTPQQVADGMDGLIDIQLRFVDQLKVLISNDNDYIHQIENSIHKENLDDADETIEKIKLLNAFYEMNGKLELILLDFGVAYKHLILAKSDWEYRFFARKLYTLMHETRQGLLSPMGKSFKQIEEIADARAFITYKKGEVQDRGVPKC